MKNIFSYYSKTPYFSLICIGLLALLYMFPEYRNRNLIMVDYEVFYKAAQRIFHGSNLYQIETDGHFVFKYSLFFNKLRYASSLLMEAIW